MRSQEYFSETLVRSIEIRRRLVQKTWSMKDQRVSVCMLSKTQAVRRAEKYWQDGADSSLLSKSQHGAKETCFIWKELVEW